MSTQSVANNPTGPMLSQIPAIRSFESAKDAIGAIKSSVNHFRGSVSLPIDFLTLPGRQGLDVKVSAIYSSNVKNKVATWNVEAPTGILGLGWEMPIDLITVFKAGSGSVTSDTYYLVANGAASPMVKTGETGNGRWTFQLRNYGFWDILYDPKKKVWTIIKENGFTYTYGGTDPDVQAIQWGVKWGNWIGSSSQRAGQEQYPVAWNLASIESPWGHRVAYAYHNVNCSVGSDGLEFTQASYVKTVTDSYGRTIIFNYGEKFGALNPSSRGIVEYQAQHSQQPEPNAYQDKYETWYLDTIDVTNAEGAALYTLKFSYDFVNMAPTGDPNYPLMWKRCLQSVYQYSPSGATLPSIRFEYNGQNDTNPGALKSVHYPTGGVARFCYKRNFIDAPKKTSIGNPLPGSTPGVWHGNDYVVFTYCRPDGGLKVLVYSWNGRWVKQDITAGAMQSIKADPDSVLVSAQADYIALSFRNTDVNQNQDELYVYRKDRSEFGSWLLYDDQPFYLRLRASDAGPSTFVAGTDFIVAYNKDYSSGPFQGFSYSWRDGTWTAPPLLPSSSDAASATGVALAALQNYYIVAFYFQDGRYGQFQIYYRDLEGGWHESSPWINGDLDVFLSEDQLLFAWSPQPTFAAATYVTGSIADKIEYSLRIFQWDENFHVLNASSPAVVKIESQITDDESQYDVFRTLVTGRPALAQRRDQLPQSQYDVFRTLVTGALINNNPANLRNVGGDLSYGSSVNWLQKSFPTPVASATVAFASGEDVAAMCENDQGRQNNQLLIFNPNFADAGWSFEPVTQDGQCPTVSGNYLTAGRTIYFRDDKGRWNPLQTGLNNLGDQQSVQNRGPNYIAYQDSSDSNARSYVVTLKNGRAAVPQELTGGPQKIYVPLEEVSLGTLLAGSRFLVSYPSSSSFREAATFYLYNLDEGDLGDFAFDYPVAYLEIEDAYDPSQSYFQSFFYANSGQSQIAYNSATGVTQYPLVTVAPGVRSTADGPPNKQPQGRSEYYYSNGLSPQYGLPYPQGWLYNYQDVLNGMLLARKDYNSENRLVSSQLNYWKVYRNDANAGTNLYGGYVRLVRTTTETDGVVEDSTAKFDETKGVELWQEHTYYDADGNEKRLLTETRYAWQVPEYATAFLSRHIYTAIVQKTKSVTGQDTQRKNYIESQVTTYRNWAESSETIKCSDTKRCKLAPYQVYQWTSPGAPPPNFDFSPDCSRSDWLLTSEIVRRSDPEGVIEEQRDVDGVPSSFLYDRHQRYLVAKFPNGSLEGGEVSYYGFEDYETDQGWILGSGATVMPNSQYPEVDAHTGTKSLRLAPATSGDAGIVKSFRPRRQDQTYLFSGWVKKPSDFDSGKGNARWQISVAGGKALALEFPDTVGAWVYLSQVIDLPASSGASTGVDVEIRGENANTSSYVLVDDLRFSPLSGLFEGTGYDTRFWLPNASLGANGESGRTVYDEFQQPIVFTNAADRVSKITTSYYSCKGNQGAFSTADPNHTVTIRPALGGDLYTFTRDSEWQSLWRSPPDVWEIVEGRLTQKSPNLEGTLSIDDPKYRSDYALAISFELREAVTQPLGLHLGQALTVQWNPQTLEWQLLEGNSIAAMLTVDQPLFALPVDPFASQLDAGDITSSLRDRFDAAGYPLPGDSIVAPGSSAGKTWTLKCSDSRYRYDLRQRNSVIDIFQVAGDWVALVGAGHLVFWANGKRIFSYQASSDLAAAPEFFFGNRIAISQLTSARDPQAEVSFDDSRGVAIQSQVLVDDREIVSQTITDDMGRQAVRTKAAYVEPSASPLFAYCSGFASLDWETSKLCGVVNDAYPEDDGYSYSREVYEASPAARVVERGMPGEPFRVGAHSTHIAYAATEGELGGIPNGFYQITTTNPNGDIYREVRNQLDQVIYKVSIKGQSEIKNATIFDDAGNPVELRSPNYHSPPEGSKPSDWVTLQTFDYAGRLTCFRSGDQGVTRLIYDRAGNLRFMQDPQGAKAGNFHYVKYDSLSRPIEMGYVSRTWDNENLKRCADTDSAWPPTPPTWRKRYFYDGNQEVKHAIGRVYQVLINNTDDGQIDVIERFCYDVLGNTITKTLAAAAYDSGREHEVDYQYDNLGNITQITYPTITGEQRLDVYYRNNRLNQVTAISETPDFSTMIATFAYRANGRPLEGTLYLGGGQRVRHTFDFNSPLWITAIRAQTQAGDTLFSESLSYTEDGFGEARYYDGTIAAASYHLDSGNSKNYQFQYSYNSIGQIENAENTEHKDWNLGVANSLVYDANGNFETLTRGGVARRYKYFDGTQRVQKVYNPADDSAFAQYEYDDGGNVIKCSVAQSALSAAHELAVDYDPATKMTTRIVDSVTGGKTLDFRYGSYNQRVLKEVRQGGQLLEKRLYIRGTNTYPLCELTTDGASATPVLYIFGPSGLIAMRKGGTTYGVLKDHLGSVRAVLNPQAQVVASYDYLTFGALAALDEPEPGFMPYLYTGQEYDREIELYNYRARFYSGELGRFIAIDPDRQYFSPYLYASNNPVLYIDPNGQFSIGSFFSAIGGAIIGAVEVLVGVCVDAVAGILEAVTGGLSTTISVALASLAGTFYGAGVSAISYSVFNFNDFSWKDYGIQMDIGAVAGAISFGISAWSSVAAESATGVKAAVQAGQEVSKWAKAANYLIEGGVTTVGGMISGSVSQALNDVASGVTPGADIGYKVLWGAVSGVAGKLTPIEPSYKAGWGNLGTRILINVAKKEAIGVSINTTTNVAHGDTWHKGLVNTVVGGALWGAISGLQVKNATKAVFDKKGARWRARSQFSNNSARA